MATVNYKPKEEFSLGEFVTHDNCEKLGGDQIIMIATRLVDNVTFFGIEDKGRGMYWEKFGGKSMHTIKTLSGISLGKTKVAFYDAHNLTKTNHITVQEEIIKQEIYNQK
jgi:hypothetical protein